MSTAEVPDSPTAEEVLTTDSPNKIPSDKTLTQGAFLAQVSLLVMAILPIYYGSIAAKAEYRRRTEALARGEELEDSEVEVLSSKDAMKFPLTASCALFSLYLITKHIDPKYLNYLLSGYFMILGVAAITMMLAEITSLRKLFPAVFNCDTFSMDFFSTDTEGKKSEIAKGTFTYVEISYAAISFAIGVWYLMTKHWIANNIFGLAFSMNAIKLLQIGSFQTGVILLTGLFFYDVFWVFGTEVMVTVAKNIDAPIKILFPTDFIENHVFGTQHSMLGLGDIVLPGILIAMYALFDYDLQTNKNTYFNVGLISYFFGLVVTMVVMNVFKHAQPALLYLVPSCVLLPMLVALINGQFSLLWNFDSTGGEEEKTDEKEKSEEKKDK